MDTSSTPSTLEKIGNLSQMHFARQLVLMAGIAGSIALGVAVVLWSQTPDYKLLYANLSADDTAKVTAALDQSGLRYRLDPRTGGIAVPAGEVHSTRMVLARSGLPPKASRGLSILDKDSTLGTSNFIEQARYTRALQEELVHTIEAMESIGEARVHLSIPKQTSFLRSRMQPSASVMLSLYPGTQLNDLQIAGIKHLVAASTVGLTEDKVSVVDQQGNLLSSEDGSALSLGRTHLRLKDQIEQQYAARIVDILTPMLGAGRVRAQVSAALDFTQVETTREEYSPDTVIRSEQTDEEQTNRETEPSGVPGLLPNDPNGAIEADEPVVASALKERRSTTRNYEVDRSISHIRSSPGEVTRLSVAVLVDYPEPARPAAEEETDAPPEPVGLSAEQHARLVELVKQTIGFDETRGDVVSVIESDFVEPVSADEMAPPSLLDNPMLWTGLRQAGAAAVVLFIIFGVLRPILKSSIASESTLPQRRVAAPAGDGQIYDEDRVTLTGGNTAGLPPGADQFQNSLAQVRALVESEPQRAARLIEGWVANDRT